MARNHIIEYSDDLTGETTDDVKPYAFGYQHIWYEIDLGERNADLLLEALNPFIEKARPLRIPMQSGYKKPKPRRKRARPPAPGMLPRETLQAIRTYVLEHHGVKLYEKGRIAQRWIDLWKEGTTPTPSQTQTP